MKVRGRDSFEATKGTVADLASEEGGFVLELNHYEKGSPYATNYAVGEGLDHLAFKVEDLDKALADAKKAGHPVVLDIKTGTSRWAYIEDPNGIWIELSA
jgi:catechol 2,3-dioxygenase-like lactoylglutathione lyase family enzyme